MRTISWLSAVSLVAGTAAISASMLGCSNKAEECKAVIDTIDDDDAALKGLNLGGPDFKTASTGLKSAADVLDKVASDLASKKVTNAELSKESGDYQAFAKEVGGEFRTFSDLLTQLQGTLEKLGPMAKDLTKGLDAVKAKCAAPDKATQADCDKVKTALKDAPDQDAFVFDKDLVEDANAFQKFAGELKAVAVDNADLKAALGDVTKGLGTLEQFMRELSAIKPKFDDAQAKLKASLAKEEPITRHINETCAGG